MIRTFPATASSLRDIRAFIRTSCSHGGLDEAARAELILAVSEACTNAIRHTQSQEISVSCHRESGCCIVEVEDQGVFEERIPVPEVDGEGGRGLFLMTVFVDELAIREGTEQRPGTLVRMVKCRQS